ncbi:proton-associated sugar transporter A-like [Littorina saxatilis]|uniref:proton-associated sugar transporter A-like n=1 Tax=Littorina saxatilis TaxID=31220 RepID=UPI0038B4E099
MDFGILRALKTLKSHPYVQYVGLGFAGLVQAGRQDNQANGVQQRKTKPQLIRLSAAVCGIELCYAAETAFVSPILLKLGVPVSLMTMIWCLSPILGFFLVPFMGSLSDRCPMALGRRRPFILVMSVGIVLGLALVPNGEALGLWMGDNGTATLHHPKYFAKLNLSSQNVASKHASLNKTGKPFQLSEEHFRGIILTILGVALLDFNCDACQSPCRAYLLDVSIPEDHSSGLTMFTVMAGLGGTIGYVMGGIDWNATSFGEAFGGHIRVVFTLVIVVFIGCVASTLTSFTETPLSELGFNEEQLQTKKKKVGKSKYKKFTNEDSDDEDTEERNIDSSADHAMYGAVRRLEETRLERDGDTFGQPFATFPHNNVSDHNVLDDLFPQAPHKHPSDDTVNFYHAHEPSYIQNLQLNGKASADIDMPEADRGMIPNGTQNYTREGNHELNNGHGDSIFDKTKLNGPTDLSLDLQPHSPIEISADVTLRTYLRSIIHMPRCLWVLCVVNLFCWMSLVCYSLYFTDFVGQAVFRGDPQAPPGSDAHNAYDDGVRLGSFGMSLYSLSCSAYSLLIERLVRRFRAKTVYVVGQLVFTVGMAIMAASRDKVAVVLLSPTAGIMYATLFTMPYLLVAHYHTSGLFKHGPKSDPKQVRGLGTDVAIVSSMVFLAQFLLSVAMGTIIYAVSSTTSVIIASSVLSSLGALCATQVTYLDL